MSKVKYRVREYNPTQNQGGSHSFYAEAVISTDITAVELAKKIAARTGMKSYEASAAIHAIADIVAEETLEGSRISLANEDGTKLVSIYPRVSGSVSDQDIQTETNGQRTVATEDDLTADRLTWTLGASVGIKYSKQFALNKQAQKVKYVATDITAADDDSQQTGDQTGGSGSTGGNSGGTTGGDGNFEDGD